MAFTEIQHRSTTASSVDSTTLAYTSNVTANNLLIIAGSNWRSGGAALTITDTVGTSYTVIEHDFQTNYKIYIAYGKAGGSGANTVTIDPSSIGNYMAFAIAEYSGNDTTTLLDVDGGFSTGTGTAASDSLTTTTANALIIGVMGFETATTRTLTPGGSYTELGEFEDNNSITAYNAVSRIATTATSYTVDWTLGASDTWHALTAAFKEAGVSGPGAGSDLSSIGMSESSANLIRVTVPEETA